MPRIVGPVALVSCVLMILPPGSGCRKPAEPPPEVSTTSKIPTIGVSLAGFDGPRRAQLKADIEAAAAKRPNLRLAIQDAGSDAPKQQAQVEEFLAAGVKAIIVVPQDAQSLTGPLAKAFDAGTAVIVLDRALIGEKYSCLIAADWKQIGEDAGKWLAGRLQGKGKLVEIKGPADSLATEELHDAFRAASAIPATISSSTPLSIRRESTARS